MVDKRALLAAMILVAILSISTSAFASPSSAGWIDKAPTPEPGGYGEALVGTGDFIYVIRCYTAASSVLFWKYDPNTNGWTGLSTAGLEAGTFRNGTALAWDNGDFIYALEGARYGDPDRRIFMRYSISGDGWDGLAETPGPQGAGDAICWSGYDGKIYALLGSSAHGVAFASYDPQSGAWADEALPPAGVDDGASLAWAGGTHIYALRGEFIEGSPLFDFWCYDIETDNWKSKQPIPDPGGVGDGGSLLWVGDFSAGHSDYIYALGGGSCLEEQGHGFYRYGISTDTWEALENLPYPVGCYNGNRLGFANGYIYYWQGAPSTWEGGNRFCAYILSAEAGDSTAIVVGIVIVIGGGGVAYGLYKIKRKGKEK